MLKQWNQTTIRYNRIVVERANEKAAREGRLLHVKLRGVPLFAGNRFLLPVAFRLLLRLKVFAGLLVDDFHR